MPFYVMMGKWGFPRCFFTTKSGFMGMAMGSAMVGDVVGILYGAYVPFVFRGEQNVAEGIVTESQVGVVRKLVCECYAEGLMAGEGMSMGQYENIVLR